MHFRTQSCYLAHFASFFLIFAKMKISYAIKGQLLLKISKKITKIVILKNGHSPKHILGKDHAAASYFPKIEAKKFFSKKFSQKIMKNPKFYKNIFENFNNDLRYFFSDEFLIFTV